MQPGRAAEGSPRRRLRLALLDAGNTLVRMDYDVVAQRLRAHGADVTADDLRRAEVRARVRLDACFAPSVSTESGQIGRLYLQYVLEGVGVTDAATLDAIAEWRRGYNPPAGLWTAAEPDAEPALLLLQQCSAGRP
jgi:hypothetical protein